MKTKKSAVPPVTPAAAVAVIENSAIPATWQEAFNFLADRMMRVISHQQTRIGELTADIEDARGVAAADEKRRGKLEAEVAGVAAALDVQDKAVKAVAERLTDTATRVEDVAALAEQSSATAAALAEQHDTTTTALAAVVESVKPLAPLVGTVDELSAIVGADAGGLLSSVNKIVARIGTAESVLKTAGAIVDRHSDRLDAVEARTGEIGRQGAATALRVDDMGALVEDYAKTASSEDGALSASLDEVGEAVRAVEMRVMELQGVAGRHSVDLDEHATALKAVDVVSERVTNVVGTVDALVKARATDADRLEGIEVRVAQVQEITVDNGRVLDDEGRRLAQVEEAVIGFVATATNIGREVAGTVAIVERFEQTIAVHSDLVADAVRRVTIGLDQMPAGFIVDQDGDLHRVNRAGDVTKLGAVTGRDGRDAPQLVASKIENGRLILTLSDRTDISCALPHVAVEPIAPAAVEQHLDPTTLGYLSKDPNVRVIQIDDMIAMRAAGKRYKEIAAKYGISERQAARLINDGKAK